MLLHVEFAIYGPIVLNAAFALTSCRYRYLKKSFICAMFPWSSARQKTFTVFSCNISMVAVIRECLHRIYLIRLGSQSAAL